MGYNINSASPWGVAMQCLPAGGNRRHSGSKEREEMLWMVTISSHRMSASCMHAGELETQTIEMLWNCRSGLYISYGVGRCIGAVQVLRIVAAETMLLLNGRGPTGQNRSKAPHLGHKTATSVAVVPSGINLTSKCHAHWP